MALNSLKDPCVSNLAYGTYAVFGQLTLTCDEPNYSGQVPLGEWKGSLCTDRAGLWRGKENTVQHDDSYKAKVTERQNNLCSLSLKIGNNILSAFKYQ